MEEDLKNIEDEYIGDKEIVKLMKLILLPKNVSEPKGGILDQIFGKKDKDSIRINPYTDKPWSILEVVEELSDQQANRQEFAEYYEAKIKFPKGPLKGKTYDLTSDISKLLKDKSRVYKDKVNKKYKVGE